MGFSNRAKSGFAAPAVALAASLILLGWLSRFDGFVVDKILLGMVATALIWRLWTQTRRTSLMIARFVQALDHGDLAQTFQTRDRGAGLDEVGEAFDNALQRLRAERHAGASENRFAEALVDEAPTPLLAVDAAGNVHLANKAARRLFREADGRPVATFDLYGREFAHALAEAKAGEKHICRIQWNGLPQRAIVAVTHADRQGESWRIVSIQIIQTELDAAEMATQTDLVRVLTHEIMNSLTPVTSLAHSADRILSRADGHDEEALADAREAIRALAQRADAISDFVYAYRDFSRSPAVAIEPFPAASWLRDLLLAFEATPQARGAAVRSHLAAAVQRIDGDANLLGQVMLNLLKNAGQAVRGAIDPVVSVRIASNEAGRTVLRVSDNGPGIPPALSEEIFLPFFTTKPEGSGVGLSFAKQVVLLHGGAIGVAESELGGATVQIII